MQIECQWAGVIQKKSFSLNFEDSSLGAFLRRNASDMGTVVFFLAGCLWLIYMPLVCVEYIARFQNVIHAHPRMPPMTATDNV